MGFQQVADYLQAPDGTLWYCRSTIDYADSTGEIGKIYYSAPIVSVQSEPAESVHLAAPWPSPAHSDVRVAYVLPRAAHVELAVYDVMGRLVRELITPTVQAGGHHELVWDGKSASGHDVGSGIYLLRLMVDRVSQRQRVALVR